MKLSYFEVQHSVDRDEVGDIPQIDSTRSGLSRQNIQEIEELLMQPFEFPNTIPTIEELQLQADARLTDMLHASFLSDLNGILISNKIKTVFDKYTLTKGRFYDATVFDKSDKKYSYHFYFYIAAPELIVYPESIFEITDIINQGEGKTVNISSFQEQVSLKREIEAGKSIRAREICLKERSDLFKLPMTGNLFVSKQLKEKLISEDITGMDFKESTISFKE